MQRSPQKNDIFKGQAASRMHYANFDDIFSEGLNSTDAQYFIENAASNVMSCKRGHTYPLLLLEAKLG